MVEGLGALVGLVGGGLLFASWLLQAHETRQQGRPVVSARFFALRVIGSVMLVVEALRVGSPGLIAVNLATAAMMAYNLWVLERVPTEPQSSNHQKHTTGNPVVRGLLDRFHATVRTEVARLAPVRTLDVGCGEGFVLQALGPAAGQASACDLSEAAVAACRASVPGVDATVASATALPYDAGQFDVVLCLEVLEHVPDPAVAVRELARVCRGHLVLSVPWEPWFQLGNLARGKYLGRLGNHPEHIQRWSPAGFRRMLDESGAVGPVRLVGSFPWTVAIAAPRSAP